MMAIDQSNLADNFVLTKGIDTSDFSPTLYIIDRPWLSALYADEGLSDADLDRDASLRASSPECAGEAGRFALTLLSEQICGGLSEADDKLSTTRVFFGSGAGFVAATWDDRWEGTGATLSYDGYRYFSPGGPHRSDETHGSGGTDTPEVPIDTRAVQINKGTITTDYTPTQYMIDRPWLSALYADEGLSDADLDRVASVLASPPECADGGCTFSLSLQDGTTCDGMPDADDSVSTSRAFLGLDAECAAATWDNPWMLTWVFDDSGARATALFLLEPGTALVLR